MLKKTETPRTIEDKVLVLSEWAEGLSLGAWNRNKTSYPWGRDAICTFWRWQIPQKNEFKSIRWTTKKGTSLSSYWCFSRFNQVRLVLQTLQLGYWELNLGLHTWKPVLCCQTVSPAPTASFGRSIFALLLWSLFQQRKAMWRGVGELGRRKNSKRKTMVWKVAGQVHKMLID